MLSHEDRQRAEAAIAELRKHLHRHVGDNVVEQRFKLPGCTAVLAVDGKLSIILDQPVNYINIQEKV